MSKSTNNPSSQKAFTLAEMLVVIAVVGLLSSIIFAIVSGTRSQGQIAKGLYFSQHLQNSLGSYAVGIWKFDEGSGTIANDTSGYGNNGTLVNSPTWRCASVDPGYTPSSEGCALELNGSTQYVNAGNHASFNITEMITVEAWVKVPSGAASDMKLIGKGKDWYDGNNSGWILTFYSYIRWRVIDSSGTAFNADYSYNIRDNAWHHLVFSYDKNSLKLFVDGSLQKEVPANGNPMIGAPGWDLIMGTAPWNPTSLLLNGLIDDIRIYERALTAAEIQKHYAEGLERLQFAEK